MDSLDPHAEQAPDPGTSGQLQILLVEPDPGSRARLDRLLRREGYVVGLAPDGRAALERLRAASVDLVVSELKLPDLTGLELLRAAKTAAPDVEVIMMATFGTMTTTFGTVEEAIQAMKDGASEVLTKPIQRVRFIKVVREALARRSLIAGKRVLHQGLGDPLRQGNKMIGASSAFRGMMTLIQQVADSSANVLIHGENGTGKGLVARVIHDWSSRRDGPFVAVNCSALPETLVESELFGYEKGVSTGGSIRKEGRFELADGGTLFLDGIADLPTVIQPKMLRLLREGEFERVGGTKTIRVRVRVITATNQDLTSIRK